MTSTNQAAIVLNGAAPAQAPPIQGKTSIELLEFVNEARTEAGEATIRHNVFLSRCKDELDGELYKTFVESAKGHAPAFEAIVMTVDQCKLVAMRESKGVRRRVLARLNELEAQVAQSPAALPHDFISALEHLLESKKAEKLAIEQRDEAIRTKAQIGDRKTATAMATASAAKREANELKEQLGFCTKHASVIAVEKAAHKKFAPQDWRKLRAWCLTHGVMAVTVPDTRWGEAKAWPAGAWMDVFGVDLVELFGEVAA